MSDLILTCDQNNLFPVLSHSGRRRLVSTSVPDDYRCNLDDQIFFKKNS